MKAKEAEKILRSVREAIQGAVSLRGEDAFDITSSSLCAISLLLGLKGVDYFLTESVGSRNNTLDVSLVMRFAAGEKEVRFLLSDLTSVLVFRWPTEEDPRVIYPIFAESTPIDVRRRWFRIDNTASEASEFPRAVTYGRA